MDGFQCHFRMSSISTTREFARNINDQAPYGSQPSPKSRNGALRTTCLNKPSGGFGCMEKCENYLSTLFPLPWWAKPLFSPVWSHMTHVSQGSVSLCGTSLERACGLWAGSCAQQLTLRRTRSGFKRVFLHGTEQFCLFLKAAVAEINSSESLSPLQPRLYHGPYVTC